MRSLNVQTLPSLLGFQLSASIGCSASFRLLSKIRNSPVWLSISSPPASEIVSGLMAAAGVDEAIRSVPPLTAVPPPVPVPELDEDVPLDPHAASTVPRNVADIPIALPRRRKSRRFRRPETSSSM